MPLWSSLATLDFKSTHDASRERVGKSYKSVLQRQSPSYVRPHRCAPITVTR
jgi:hypothetical protein